MNQKGLANFIFIVVIVAIITIGGYFFIFKNNNTSTRTQTEQQIQQTDTSDWRIYQNEQYGFEMKYPPAYRPTEMPDHSFIVFSAGASGVETMFSVRVSKYSLSKEEAIIQAYPQISQFSKKDAVVNGNNFVILTYDFTSINGGVAQHLGEALTGHNGSVYVIKRTSVTLSEDMFNKILATFAFKK